MTVTKQDITDRLHDVMGLSKAECKGLVEAFFDTIRETLAQGEAVKLLGFGNFRLREKRAARSESQNQGADGGECPPCGGLPRWAIAPGPL